MSVYKEFFTLLRDAVLSIVESYQDSTSSISTQTLIEIYKISKSHDLTHLLADVFDRHSLIDDSQMVEKFRIQRNLAIYRYEQMQYEFEQICLAFDEEKIPYIPLKGAIVRKYYPEPWMRTSCDIDILVRNEDLARAGEVLKSKLDYTFTERASHDVSYYSPSGVHLELHFGLTELNEKFSAVVENVWDICQKQENSYCYDDFGSCASRCCLRRRNS